MTKHNFLFTYSISQVGDSEQAAKAADRIRKGIANLQKPDWVKLTSVETTFSGLITLTEKTSHKKRAEARGIVENELRSIMAAHKEHDKTRGSVSLLVDGLGARIDTCI